MQKNKIKKTPLITVLCNQSLEMFIVLQVKCLSFRTCMYVKKKKYFSQVEFIVPVVSAAYPQYYLSWTI